MPTYAYACTDCDHRFDAVQSFSDDALTTCPECEGRLRKVFNSVGVVFKGSGFYRTDSRSTSSDTGSSAGTNSGSGSGSDSSAPSGTASSTTPAADSGTSSTPTTSAAASSSTT